MFIIIKLTTSYIHGFNNLTILNTIKGVKANIYKIISKLFEIEENFNSMEREFNMKFDKLIPEYEKVMNDFYLNCHKKQEEHETNQREEEQEQVSETKKYNPIALYHALDRYLFNQILSQIVFWDFLKFYDEYSYSINQRIHETYKIKNKYGIYYKLGRFTYPTKMSLIKAIKKLFLRKIRYRDIHYFRNKLEEKLSKKFKIDILRLRTILYGCNFKKNQKMETKYIRKYYKMILNYKDRYCANNIYEFFRIYHFQDRLPTHRHAIMYSMNEHAYCFNIDPPHLYNYHLELSELTNFSETRFRLYEELLKKYGHWKDFPLNFSNADRFLFSVSFWRVQYGIESSLRDEIFSYITYDQKNRNRVSSMLEDIKKFLNRSLTQAEI